MADKLLTELPPQAVTCLKAMLADPEAEHWAGEIARTTGVFASNVHRYFRLFEQAGFVDSFEQAGRTIAGRPRRYYVFCPGGADAARDELRAWGRD